MKFYHINILNTSSGKLYLELAEVQNPNRIDKCVKKYIEGFNDKKYPAIQELCPNQNFYFVFHSVDDILNGAEIYKFGQEYFIDNDRINFTRQIVRQVDDKGKEKEVEVTHLPYRPLVHFLLFDLYSKEKNSKDYKIKEFCLKRYYNIVDSSIWNYFLPYICKEEERYEYFHFLIKELAKNYKSDLYSLDISQEYVNLNARLLKESFLKSSSLNEGHGQYISPFLFHSEANMIYAISKNYGVDIISDSTDEGNGKALLNDLVSHKWRFLLVDDHGINNLSRKSIDKKEDCIDENTNLPKYCKLNILINRLSRLKLNIGYKYDGESCYIPAECDIFIVCVQSLEEAFAKLKEQKFEIILLDYLLQWNTEKQHLKDYGYQLFTSPDSNNPKLKTKDYDGPFGRQFIMFISAFTTAVNERLLAEGIHKSEEEWHIAGGACPTNTPYLFLYNLVHLMEKRWEDSGVRKLSIDNISKCINNVYGKGDVRKAANENFDKVLSLLYHYKRLMNDVKEYDAKNIFSTGGSVLATHFISSHPYLGGLLEHLTQLVYLTAFGTIRQWPEMWNEYLYIRAIFEGERVVKNNQALKAIEDYISKLKSGSL